MTTLKDHQREMVALLAGSAVLSASGSRMAHALHDVLAYPNDTNAAPVAHTERRIDATTPGLNDALLALDVEAVKPKRTSAEQQIAQLENTIRQLKGRVADLLDEKEALGQKFMNLRQELDLLRETPEQAGVRKEDTQVAPCEHEWVINCQLDRRDWMICCKCGVKK